MNFLSIDFSTDLGSLFLKTKNKTFIEILQSDKLNNDLLMKKVLDFFEEKNLNFDDISGIFVNQGPGNFSGLRGSLAIAKGISLSKNIDLFGYDTFILLCSKFFNKKKNILSFIKFREKYFMKKFNEKLNCISSTQEIKKEMILKNYKNAFKVLSANSIKDFDKETLRLNNVEIAVLDHNQLEFLKLNHLLNEDLIKPLYLS